MAMRVYGLAKCAMMTKRMPKGTIWDFRIGDHLYVVATRIAEGSRLSAICRKFILLARSLLAESEEKSLTRKLCRDMFPRLLGALMTELDAHTVTFFRDEEKIIGLYCS
jgi:hypothetical protein